MGSPGRREPGAHSSHLGRSKAVSPGHRKPLRAERPCFCQGGCLSPCRQPPLPWKKGCLRGKNQGANRKTAREEKKANSISPGSLHFLSSSISFVFPQRTGGESRPAAAPANAGTVTSLIEPRSSLRAGLREMLEPAKYARKWLRMFNLLKTFLHTVFLMFLKAEQCGFTTLCGARCICST